MKHRQKYTLKKKVISVVLPGFIGPGFTKKKNKNSLQKREKKWSLYLLFMTVHPRRNLKEKFYSQGWEVGGCAVISIAVRY